MKRSSTILCVPRGWPMHHAAECGRGQAECQSPAVKDKRRCRMHGGTNPGAPVGNRNARKHGARSAKMARLFAFINPDYSPDGLFGGGERSLTL